MGAMLGIVGTLLLALRRARQRDDERTSYAAVRRSDEIMALYEDEDDEPTFCRGGSSPVMLGAATDHIGHEECSKETTAELHNEQPLLLLDEDVPAEDLLNSLSGSANAADLASDRSCGGQQQAQEECVWLEAPHDHVLLEVHAEAGHEELHPDAQACVASPSREEVEEATEYSF